MGVSPQLYHYAAFGAMRWFVDRWVLEFLEIEFICSIVDVYFGLKSLSAFWTVLPTALMFFGIMITAQSIAAVVSRATVGSIGERDIVVLIVANPLSATLRLYQIFCFSAQSAFVFASGGLLLCHRSSSLSLSLSLNTKISHECNELAALPRVRPAWA